MRKLFTILAAVLLTTTVFAQSPQKMSYQAVIRNSSDAIVSNHSVGMRISILQGSENGTVVYTETQTQTTNTNGLVSIEIGNGAEFNAINWSEGPYFIKTETDPIGGTSYSITGTSQLLSVPYALHAKTAESITGTITETDPIFIAWDKNYSDLTNTPTTITTAQADAIAANKAKLSGIAAGAEVNVQSDWDQSTTTADDFIKNKPTIPTAADGSETKVIAGTNVTLTGSGTTANPYVVNTVMSMNQVQRDALVSTAGLMVYNTTTNKPNYYNGTVWMNYDGTPAKTLAVGDAYKGGIIAYILKSGDPGFDANDVHGLIIAPNDQSAGIQWYNGSVVTTGATGTAIGTGNANTIAIVNTQGDGSYAAKLCFDLELGGYSDWYLPSENEWVNIYNNKAAIGGTFSAGYWSSTEVGPHARVQVFDGTYSYLEFKYALTAVRAARSF